MLLSKGLLGIVNFLSVMHVVTEKSKRDARLLRMMMTAKNQSLSDINAD